MLLDYLEGDGTGEGPRACSRRVRAQDADIPVIAVAERGDVRLAAEAVKAGANDFLVRGEKLGERVATLLAKVHTFVDLVHRHRRCASSTGSCNRAASEHYRIAGASPRSRTCSSGWSAWRASRGPC